MKYYMKEIKIYGYARISRPQQSIDRQIRNIKAEYPSAIILQESFTGTKMDRPEWNKLYERARAGDTIVFDSVSRMARNAAEGVQIYFELYEKGIQLIFLKEHYIDTSVYANNLRDKIEYVALCVNKFAERHGIARNVACNYLHSNNGLRFLDEFYPEESTLPERIVVEDLDEVCRNYGGVPTW